MTSDPPPEGAIHYNDITPSTTFYSEINYITRWGIVSGYSEANNERSFQPDRFVTRGEAAT